MGEGGQQREEEATVEARHQDELTDRPSVAV
jgi:hypothetical protein